MRTESALCAAALFMVPSVSHGDQPIPPGWRAPIPKDIANELNKITFIRGSDEKIAYMRSLSPQRGQELIRSLRSELEARNPEPDDPKYYIKQWLFWMGDAEIRRAYAEALKTNNP